MDARAIPRPEVIGEIVCVGRRDRGLRKNPEANRTSFINGWFRTGDNGRLDRDGYLFITGRIKEIINRGGQKISPREIDEVLVPIPRSPGGRVRGSRPASARTLPLPSSFVRDTRRPKSRSESRRESDAQIQGAAPHRLSRRTSERPTGKHLTHRLAARLASTVRLADSKSSNLAERVRRARHADGKNDSYIYMGANAPG